jgi:hypothetical protein
VNVIFINGVQVYCYNGNNVPVKPEDGAYSGIFTVTYFVEQPNSWASSGSGRTTVVLRNDKYSCTGNSNRIPAGGSGSFEIKDDAILFNDENGWTCDFDGNLILNGVYFYKCDGKKLQFSKRTDYALYEFDLEIVNPQPSIKEGIYSGTFSILFSSNSDDYERKVTLELRNGKFNSTDYSGRYPSANGAGSYSINSDTIIFRDDLTRCAASPMCDPILIGKFYYTIEGKRLKFTNGGYVFILELVDTGECDQKVIISAAEYEKLPAAFPIRDMKIVDNCLKMIICSSGCDGRSWVVRLVDSGDVAHIDVAVYPPLPPRRALRLYFENREVCTAMPSREFSFNIEDLQIQETNKILLNIAENQILYEY